MSDSKVDKLIELLDEKKKLLEEMLVINKDQQVVLEKEEFEKLDEFLSEKDLIIEKINDIDLRFKNLNLEDKIEDKKLIELTTQINNCLKNIKQIEDLNNDKLAKAIKDMKSGLKETRDNMKVISGYGNSDPYHAFATQGGTLFIDQDS